MDTRKLVSQERDLTIHFGTGPKQFLRALEVAVGLVDAGASLGGTRVTQIKSIQGLEKLEALRAQAAPGASLGTRPDAGQRLGHLFAGLFGVGAGLATSISGASLGRASARVTLETLMKLPYVRIVHVDESAVQKGGIVGRTYEASLLAFTEMAGLFKKGEWPVGMFVLEHAEFDNITSSPDRIIAPDRPVIVYGFFLKDGSILPVGIYRTQITYYVRIPKERADRWVGEHRAVLDQARTRIQAMSGASAGSLGTVSSEMKTLKLEDAARWFREPIPYAEGKGALRVWMSLIRPARGSRGKGASPVNYEFTPARREGGNDVLRVLVYQAVPLSQVIGTVIERLEQSKDPRRVRALEAFRQRVRKFAPSMLEAARKEIQAKIQTPGPRSEPKIAAPRPQIKISRKEFAGRLEGEFRFDNGKRILSVVFGEAAGGQYAMDTSRMGDRYVDEVQERLPVHNISIEAPQEASGFDILQWIRVNLNGRLSRDPAYRGLRELIEKRFPEFVSHYPMRKVRTRPVRNSISNGASLGEKISDQSLDGIVRKITGHSLGALNRIAAHFADGLISQAFAEAAPPGVTNRVIGLIEREMASSGLRKQDGFSQIPTSNKLARDLFSALDQAVRENRPAFNLVTSDQLTPDVVRFLRWLHESSKGAYTLLYDIGMSPRMRESLQEIDRLRVVDARTWPAGTLAQVIQSDIRSEKLREFAEKFGPVANAAELNHMITVNASQAICDELFRFPGLNLIAPVTENDSFRKAPARDQIGALLVERSAAYLLAHHRGDLVKLQALGLDVLLNPRDRLASLAHLYEIRWSAVDRALGEIVTAWRGHEASAQSA